MSTPSLTEIMAMRILDGPHGPVRVLIGRPALFDDTDPAGGYFCPYRIEGLEDSPLEFFAGGVDSMQALILALGMIGDRLKAADSELSFLGDSKIGFPTSNPVDGDSMRLSVDIRTS